MSVLLWAQQDLNLRPTDYESHSAAYLKLTIFIYCNTLA